jgi:hypothetical protein
LDVLTTVILAGVLQASAPVPIAASVLPPSRHAVASGDPVTFFAAMVNQGAGDAVNCRIEIAETGPFTYTYRAFDPATSSFTADPNTPVDIAGGGTQVFVLGFEFSGTMDRTSFEPAYVCDNGEALPVHALTNIALTASGTPQPDILALASTNGPPGVNDAFGNSVFAVSITNLNGQFGVTVPIEVNADMMDRTFHALLEVCEIDSQAQCLTPRSDRLVSQLTGRESRSFAIWVGGNFSRTQDLYDIIRVRALIRDPDSRVLLGSTSVAHSGFPFRQDYCSGRYPSTIWTASITRQSVAEVNGAHVFTSLVDDVNIYGDGEGGLLAVPIDGQGARYRGSAPNAFPHDLDISCFASQSNEVRLDPVPAYPGGEPSGNSWQGRLRWTVNGVSGSADESPEVTRLINVVRGAFTTTDEFVFPIARAPGNFPVRTPVDGYAGNYTADFLGSSGAIRQVAGWTVTEASATGSVTFSTTGDNVETCALTFTHSPVLTTGFDPLGGYREFNENYRRILGEITDCDGGDALGIAGLYDGVMVYQPMTVVGAPDENGLEVILTPSDPEQEQHMLWFLLRQ